MSAENHLIQYLLKEWLFDQKTIWQNARQPKLWVHHMPVQITTLANLHDSLCLVAVKSFWSRKERRWELLVIIFTRVCLYVPDFVRFYFFPALKGTKPGSTSYYFYKCLFGCAGLCPLLFVHFYLFPVLKGTKPGFTSYYFYKCLFVCARLCPLLFVLLFFLE